MAKGRACAGWRATARCVTPDAGRHGRSSPRRARSVVTADTAAVRYALGPDVERPGFSFGRGVVALVARDRRVPLVRRFEREVRRRVRRVGDGDLRERREQHGFGVAARAHLHPSGLDLELRGLLRCRRRIAVTRTEAALVIRPTDEDAGTHHVARRARDRIRAGDQHVAIVDHVIEARGDCSGLRSGLCSGEPRTDEDRHDDRGAHQYTPDIINRRLRYPLTSGRRSIALDRSYAANSRTVRPTHASSVMRPPIRRSSTGILSSGST